MPGRARRGVPRMRGCASTSSDGTHVSADGTFTVRAEVRDMDNNREGSVRPKAGYVG